MGSMSVNVVLLLSLFIVCMHSQSARTMPIIKRFEGSHHIHHHRGEKTRAMLGQPDSQLSKPSITASNFAMIGLVPGAGTDYHGGMQHIHFIA
ncbi:hypothetical protein PSHT_07825 [Puccinia striiformis]|uniref:Uncharacterized protein n=9 Tax=Puccinia striiformis TaxID=27350 RepID=A0A2S4UZD6_9BASI|nr:hypothetical protein H4Q26_001382 [Puccinia striiformis f. sp. tritici PST-130]KAI9623746.1 hypothetical protein H4Q26_014475 [Puccinia striiformis f. sp. tritici PST-130]POW02555.1 hypothetical protein PSHT_12062 [Puccinia striiformis]POW13286.1 hypothetical protein PSHT_07825 [Puccinia striiformis]POW17249.1 hypothetical protein PSTT_00744 [Puccinia striiformis]